MGKTKGFPFGRVTRVVPRYTPSELTLLALGTTYYSKPNGQTDERSRICDK